MDVATAWEQAESRMPHHATLPASCAGFGAAAARGSPCGALMRRSGLAALQAHLRHVDLDYIGSQMVHLLVLCVRPVAQVAAFRKQVRNSWARTDWGFAGLLASLLFVSAFAHGVATGAPPTGCAWLATRMVLVNLALCGAVAATILQQALNAKFLRSASQLYGAAAQSVEWRFALDVHCNALVPWFGLVHVMGYLTLPLWLHHENGVLSAALGNALVFLGAFCYIYVSALCYSGLPFLEHPDRLYLKSVPWLVVVCVVLTFCGVNTLQAGLQLMF